MAKKKYSECALVASAARKIWSFHNLERKACLAGAQGVVLENGQRLKKFTCAICKNEFSYSDIKVDHKIPIGNTLPKDNGELKEFIDKLRVPLEKLQVLCNRCHNIKTNKENECRNMDILRKEIYDYLEEDPHIKKNIECIFIPSDHKFMKKISRIIKKIKISEGVKQEKYKEQFKKLSVDFFQI